MSPVYMVFKLLGCLALLMFGMKTMSEGLQKLAGPQLRNILAKMTKNRFAGLFTGAFVTASVQSSTATTVMTVSFVNAGLLSLAQAISIIMGANIGTTATGWLIAIFGFQIKMSELIFPIFALAIPLIFSSNNRRKSVGEFIYGFAFMFLGLSMLRENANDLLTMQAESGELFQMVLARHIAAIADWGIISRLLFLLIGGVLTMCMQSSAAVMAITMILCSSGALDIYSGIALVLGENIGTTITSNIAALTANTQSRRAALAHLLFNTFGVVWVMLIFTPFITFICDTVGFDPAHPDSIRITYVICAFHTAFNICNVLILIWQIGLMEKIVCRIIPTIKAKEEDEFSLRYIGHGLLDTGELTIIEVEKEVELYGIRIAKMFSRAISLFSIKDDAEFTRVFTKLENHEEKSDQIEIEIANYINTISDNEISQQSQQKARELMSEASDIECVGDGCLNIGRQAVKLRKDNIKLTEKQTTQMKRVFEYVSKSLKAMNSLIEEPETTAPLLEEARTNRHEMHALRKDLMAQNLTDVSNHVYSDQQGVAYMIILNECEKIMNYLTSVISARGGKKSHRTK